MEARVLNYIDRTTEETIKTLLLFCIHYVFYNSSDAIAHQEDEVRIRQIMKKKKQKNCLALSPLQRSEMQNLYQKLDAKPK